MVTLTIRIDSHTDKYGLVRKEKRFIFKSFQELDDEKLRVLLHEIRIVKDELDKKMGELINESNRCD
jgi:hypothetical protein